MVLRKCYAEVLSQGVRSRCVQDDSSAHWITLPRLLCTCAEWGRAAREWMTWGSCECENTSCESLPCHVRAWHASQCSMPPTIVHAPHIKASHSSTCSSFPFPAYTLAIMTGAESSVKVTKPCWLHLTQFIAIHSIQGDHNGKTLLLCYITCPLWSLSYCKMVIVTSFDTLQIFLPAPPRSSKCQEANVCIISLCWEAVENNLQWWSTLMYHTSHKIWS